MPQLLSFGAIFLLISGFIVYGYFVSKFLNQLRTHHEQAWASLGNPTMFDRTSSYADKSKFFQYLNKRTYRQLNDKSLNRSGDLARTAVHFTMVSVPLAMGTMLAIAFICMPGSCG